MVPLAKITRRQILFDFLAGKIYFRYNILNVILKNIKIKYEKK